ncbi:hypothetical protein [Paenibacillus thalictri]|uniref:Uncharacterized protein n=1 Tax=Paenibacillus thalictri TaxID=2527873 RepID=A0A4Q9DLJ0_9BACL|nr:hypothetical protein [Paenibacillus thalictri]TBL75290.1 hypothetical protein EYB31_23030 [Paenibacillus thalictri]
MSLPNIPNITPEIHLNREEAIHLLLTSIAMEEIGISHILNAEGEKIQHVLNQCPSIYEIVQINKSVERLIEDLIIKEMLLFMKLQTVLELDSEKEIPMEEEMGE